MKYRRLFQDACGINLLSRAVVERNGHLRRCGSDRGEGTDLVVIVVVITLRTIVEEQAIFRNVVLKMYTTHQ